MKREPGSTARESTAPPRIGRSDRASRTPPVAATRSSAVSAARRRGSGRDGTAVLTGSSVAQGSLTATRSGPASARSRPGPRDRATSGCGCRRSGRASAWARGPGPSGRRGSRRPAAGTTPRRSALGLGVGETAGLFAGVRGGIPRTEIASWAIRRKRSNDWIGSSIEPWPYTFGWPSRIVTATRTSGCHWPTYPTNEKSKTFCLKAPRPRLSFGSQTSAVPVLPPTRYPWMSVFTR